MNEQEQALATAKEMLKDKLGSRTTEVLITGRVTVDSDSQSVQIVRKGR